MIQYMVYTFYYPSQELNEYNLRNKIHVISLESNCIPGRAPFPYCHRFFFIFHLLFAMNIAKCHEYKSHISVKAPFPAMEEAAICDERECTPIRICSRKSERQPLKYTDKIWIVTEVLNFEKGASYSAKRFHIRRNRRPEAVSGKPAFLNSNVTKDTIEKMKRNTYAKTDAEFKSIVQEANTKALLCKSTSASCYVPVISVKVLGKFEAKHNIKSG